MIIQLKCEMGSNQSNQISMSSLFITISKIPTWEEFILKSKRENQLPAAASPIEQGGSHKADPLSVEVSLADKVSLYQGDLTKLEVDVIVNAANESLLGGGGVDGAIHRAAGEALLAECRTLGGCRTGEAKITSGYNLPAKYVIHTVGPRGENSELLRKCYENSLNMMLKRGLRTIAFPCISTGIFGYPPKNAANVAISTVKDFIQKHPDQVDRVIFCVFLRSDLDIYQNLMFKYFQVNEAKTKSSQY